MPSAWNRDRTLAIALVATLACLPWVPPGHVHETTDADGHHHSVTHRHAESHAAERVPSDHEHHEGPRHDEESVVVTLSPVFTLAKAYSPISPALVVVGVVTEPAANVTTDVRPQYVERVIHGPPRAATGSRAPPATPAL